VYHKKLHVIITKNNIENIGAAMEKKKESKFCVVETENNQGEREVYAVPESWIEKTLIQGKFAPQNDWRREKCIILKHGIRKFEGE
jgi:hypothetical protein